MRLHSTAVNSICTAAAVGVLAAGFNAVAPGSASAMTSHAGWPDINGMLLMNKADADRPLDGRPGHDPFDGTDSSYSCDGVHRSTSCVGRAGRCWLLVRCSAGVVVPDSPRHNELLGGHGNDVIHGGPTGDVIWGDYKTPADGDTAQPEDQSDHLYGGAGRDFIYAGHGRNVIVTGGGADVIHAHFGHGSITCGSSNATVFLSRHSRRRYTLHGCRRISYATLGY